MMGPASPEKRWAPWLAFGVVCLVALAGFAYTVHLRQPWFGTCPANPITWLSSQMVLFARHWYREGALALKLACYWEPLSVEYPTLASRTIYSSYPSGGVVPLYLMAKLTGTEPSLALAMACNLLTQLMIALTLALLAFRFVRACNGRLLSASLSAAIPPLLLFGLPGPFYFFQTLYLPDTLVLLPFALATLLEALRDDAPTPAWQRGTDIAQAFVCFWGIFVDWLFVFVVLALYVKRIADRSLLDTRGKGWTAAFVRHSILFALPCMAAMGIFAVQLWYFGRFSALFERFQERTGLESGHFLSLSRGNTVFKLHILSSYGTIGLYLVGVSLVFMSVLILVAAYRTARSQPLSAPLSRALAITWLLLIPCILHFFFLKQHSTHPFHSFSPLKFSLALAVVPLVVLPAILAAACEAPLDVFLRKMIPGTLQSHLPARPRLISLVSPVLAFLAATYVYVEHSNATRIFPPPPEHDPVTFGSFLKQNTSYVDIVFSSDPLLITTPAYFDVAYSMKCVHDGSSLKKMWETAGPVSDDFTVGFLIRGEDVSMANRELLELMAAADWCGRFDGIRFYKTSKERFLDVCQKHGVPQ